VLSIEVKAECDIDNKSNCGHSHDSRPFGKPISGLDLITDRRFIAETFPVFVRGLNPMFVYPNERIALFIDGANLYATSKSLGFDIDYKRLLEHFRKKGQLVRALYYTALAEDQEYSSIRPLIDWLDYNGYSMVTKPTKEFTDSAGRRKVKGNMDIELTVDHAAGRQSRSYHLVLRRWRLPLAGSRPAGKRPQGQCRLDASDAAADGCGRIAQAG